MEFHKKVYEGYLEVQKKFPNRIKIIYGEASKEQVKKDALEVVIKFLEEKVKQRKMKIYLIINMKR